MRGHPFDAETAVAPAGEHKFLASTSPLWSGGLGAHGGHLAATGLRAIKAEIGEEKSSARSLTVHFVSRTETGEVEITTETMHRGRTISIVKGLVWQGGRLVAVLVAVLGDKRASPSLPDAPMPELPAPSHLPGISAQAAPFAPPFMQHYDFRVGIGGDAFSGGPARTGGWVCPIPPREIDDLLVTAYADVWGRSIFVNLEGPIPAPTVELTINYLGELPRPSGADGEDYCLVLFETSAAHDGYFREEGRIWSRDGVLLAACSQLGMLLT